MGVRVGLCQQTQFLQLRHDRAAGGEAVLAFQRAHEIRIGHTGHRGQRVSDFRERHPGFAVEDGRHRQIVPLAHGKIVEIVGRRDLHRAGAFFRVGIFVGDDRNAPADQRQNGEFSDQIGEPGIGGMHRHRGVAEHGFRPRGGDGDETVGCALDRVFYVPEIAAHLPAFDFEVGNGGVELRVPVHQPAVAIDQTLAVQRDEHLAHRLGQPLVHGEAFARPVQRGAEAAQLAGDGAAGLRLPLPHPVKEPLAPERLAAAALLGQQALHHHLGGDAGMVGAGLPQRVAPLHAAPADQRVLHREGQRMPHMQAAGDVRRRDHDGERGGVARGVAGEGAGRLPALVEPRLGGVRGMRLVQHGLSAWRAESA